MKYSKPIKGAYELTLTLDPSWFKSQKNMVDTDWLDFVVSSGEVIHLLFSYRFGDSRGRPVDKTWCKKEITKLLKKFYSY